MAQYLLQRDLERKDIIPVLMPDIAGSQQCWFLAVDFCHRDFLPQACPVYIQVSCGLHPFSGSAAVELMMPTKGPPGLETMLRARQVGKVQASGDGRGRNRVVVAAEGLLPALLRFSSTAW